MILKILRNSLGMLIVFLNQITLPKQLKRSAEEQQQVQQKANKLSLYQFYACPFCIKTRRAIHRLNIDIDYRDAMNNETHRQALKNGGGSIKVPCLRIDEGEKTSWMYESSDIIAYLEKEFGQKAA